MNSRIYDRLVTYIIENQNKFYRLAYSYVKNKEDALDAVQNAICKALEKHDSLRNEHAIRTWFYSILVNESLTIINARKNALLSRTDSSIEPVYIEKGFELRDELHEKLSRLEEPDQSIIRLRFFEDLSLKEISEILNLNISTVKSKLYRGLKKLEITVKEGEIL